MPYASYSMVYRHVTVYRCTYCDDILDDDDWCYWCEDYDDDGGFDDWEWY